MEKHRKEWILVGIFVAIFVLMSILSPSRFLSLDNLQSMAFQVPEFGILSLAMMIVIVTGGINLSVVSTTALSGIMTAYVLSTLNKAGGSIFLTIILSIIVAVLTALICGFINGYVIAYIGVPAILVTLGTMTLFEGISLNFTKGGAISGFPEQYYVFGNGSILKIPIPMLIFVLVIVVTLILLERTPWGLSVYMIGCNPKATMFSGINVKKILIKVYLFSALLGSIAAVIMTSRYNSAKVDYGSSYLMQSISAAVLGGTAISGGYGKVMGTVVAVGIIQVISSGLNILGINRYIVDIIMGTILIVVLGMNVINLKKFQFNTKWFKDTANKSI